MKKTFFSLYAVVCYCIFFATFLYLVGFVSGLLVPKTIDTTAGNAPSSAFMAILVNLGLLSLFAVQHSVMARQGFKQKWTRIVPEPIERSTYVLFASIAVILLLFFWQPLPYTIWNVANTTGGYFLLGVSFLGWGMVLLSTFLLNHFHLFGLNQVYDHITNKEQRILRFRTPFLYKVVRHPLYLGFLIAFWSAPVMTAGHFLFSLVMTIYVFIGIYHEEKDLARMYGGDYLRYQQKTPMILPYNKA